MRRRLPPALTAAVVLLLGLLLFRYTTGAVRGLLGDVLVIVFLDACLAATGLGRSWMRLLLVAVIAVGTEALQRLQLVEPGSHWLLHLTIGSTYDPLDFAAYAIGLVAAANLEWAWQRQADLDDDGRKK